VTSFFPLDPPLAFCRTGDLVLTLQLTVVVFSGNINVMKCVLLAAGIGKRMRPLTLENPKPMVRVAGKPLLEHIINELPEEIDELVIVVGYMKEKIQEYFGEKFGRFRIKYVTQDEPLGTYHALSLCEPYVAGEEKFLMMYSDDIHGKQGLEDLIKFNDTAMSVYEVPNPERFGVVELGSDGYISSVEEKPEKPRSNMISNGAFLHTPRVFEYSPPPGKGGERWVTDSVAMMLAAGCKVGVAKSSLWIPIGYPEDLKKVEEYYRNQ
jgi:NDP-sugar pyrophosphorylase family protein